jgi:hypothetical protein
MSTFWDAFLWSAISVVVLVPAIAAWVYGLTHRQPATEEDPAERAYWDAKEHAAKALAAGQPEPPARHVYAGTGQSNSNAR